jgi:anti-anti-sigma regulatory factor
MSRENGGRLAKTIGFWHAYCDIILNRISTSLDTFRQKREESMSTATTIQPHIAYELIKDTNHDVMIVEFLSQDFASPIHARELGEQLHSLIQPHELQYFVIDFAGVRTLGSTAFGEIVHFVRRATPVWVCNLDKSLRLGASLSGLDACAHIAENRHLAISRAEKTARRDEEDTIDFSDLKR